MGGFSIFIYFSLKFFFFFFFLGGGALLHNYEDNYLLLIIFLDAADKFAPLRAKKSNTHIRKIETRQIAFRHADIPTVKCGLKKGFP